ncbi:50S ribosomal protein L23 [Candidatus Woesebacteria bacterium RIFOXYA1_FULL_43_9]|uniref:50S ribosomal protein L23 n=1 Tax=Candidatus Woesebacteria bacterium RIFOXYA1_FULL_43_9 TaxID=1802534 RepID=A0A1F8CMI5_9BACT|nr:MAG: 50S ribosomal protein L23 [Candidatus Woesebacteria bacterium RIFOXYA1_FULL_43_9]
MKPIYTERSINDAKKGVYTFAFPLIFNKAKIKRMVAEVFGVEVGEVKTTNYKTQAKRNAYGKKVTRKGFKKAFVTLKKGVIDLFEAKTK